MIHFCNVDQFLYILSVGKGAVMAKMRSYAGTVGAFLVDKADFCVFRFQPHAEGSHEHAFEKQSISCVLPRKGVRESDALLIKGYWRKHEQYGWQFWVMDYSPTMPAGAEDIQMYLAAGHIEGVGPELASRLVKRFGDRTMEVMQSEPVALTAIEGIGSGKADVIHSHTRHLVKLQGIHRQLADWGVPAATTSKLVAKYETSAPAVVRDNPWRLMKDYGDTLKAADRVAALSEVVGTAKRMTAIAEASLGHYRQQAGFKMGYSITELHNTVQQVFPGESVNWADALPALSLLTLDDETYLIEPENAAKLQAMLGSPVRRSSITYKTEGTA